MNTVTNTKPVKTAESTQAMGPLGAKMFNAMTLNPIHHSEFTLAATLNTADALTTLLNAATLCTITLNPFYHSSFTPFTTLTNNADDNNNNDDEKMPNMTTCWQTSSL